jgi:tetratricopeptide (TPR) repeat protein
MVQFPSVPVYRKELANTQNNLAIALARNGNWAAADEVWRQALKAFTKLAFEYPDVPVYVAGKSLALGNLGWLRLQQNNPVMARPYLEEAIGQLEGVLKSNPDNPLYRRAQRDQYRYLLEALTRLGKKAEADKIRRLLAQLDGQAPAKSETATAKP